MNMPETVWRAYIDNEIQLQNYDKVRELYEKLLERSKHVKIWISYAHFEHSTGNNAFARAIFDRAERSYVDHIDHKDERALLLEAWKTLEI